MKQAKRPSWMSPESWQRHQVYVATLNAQLLAVLRREMAEARADLEADRNDPDLQQRHESRIYVLECQIDDAQGTASYQQEPQRPLVVKADKQPPRPRRKESRTAKPQKVMAPPEL